MPILLIIIGAILSLVGLITLFILGSMWLIEKFDDHSRDYKLRK